MTSGSPNVPFIDLLLIEAEPGSRTMAAILRRPDGSLFEVPPVPASGALAPIAAALWPECAEAFATVEDLQGYLGVQHFGNMSRKTNRAGQAYPFRPEHLSA